MSATHDADPGGDGATFPLTCRTRPTRHRERVGHERHAVEELLDEAPMCHVGFRSHGGAPRVLPMVHARVGSSLFLHASSGSGSALLARESGLEVCVEVTVLDGLVLARSAMHHSMNFRSAVIYGHAVAVTDRDEKAQALVAIVDHLVAGRSQHCRPPNRRELDATAVFQLEIIEASMKSRSGPPVDDKEDLGLPAWAGVIPMELVSRDPIPADGLTEGAVPVHLREHLAGDGGGKSGSR